MDDNEIKLIIKKRTMLEKFYSFWERIPTPNKIVIYQLIAGLMTLLANDVLNIQTENAYVLLILQAVNNLILWYAQKFGEKRFT